MFLWNVAQNYWHIYSKVYFYKHFNFYKKNTILHKLKNDRLTLVYSACAFFDIGLNTPCNVVNTGAFHHSIIQISVNNQLIDWLSSTYTHYIRKCMIHTTVFQSLHFYLLRGKDPNVIFLVLPNFWPIMGVCHILSYPLVSD